MHQRVDNLNHDISDEVAWLLRQIHNTAIWLSSVLGNDRVGICQKAF